ncbi:hypothetical protein PHET_03830 [Paragonimus heterotremus]|uniref:DAGKc domain-containing protein n=1 Tax=Paragonimus heterotremus TaxID=100268 RepID=A0A8J4TBF3_9TREM|nr:hypothetical protein PHET_03830 [Paragonimus heterotremus]
MKYRPKRILWERCIAKTVTNASFLIHPLFSADSFLVFDCSPVIQRDMAKIWRTVRNHPKKSLLLAGFTFYIYDYLEEKYTQDVVRRKFCSLVKPLGNVTVSPTDQLRRLTVFLNPFARRGNLLKDFEKNVAPILQLGGLDVQMVYTDNDTEIKDFVSVLDPTSTDGILIASDDHVLQKAVSALLQRTDWQTSRLAHLPIGVVPLGVWNTFARSVSSCKNPIEWCYDLLSPLLKGTVKRHHVLEISSISTTKLERPIVYSDLPSASDEHCVSSGEAAVNTDRSRQTYSLLGLEWSIWRDVEQGGGAGSPKRKSKPTDTNEHRGLLLPLSLSSPSTWTRYLGVTWRQCRFWITSINPPESSTDIPAFFISDSPDSSPRFKRRMRTKRYKLVYTPACKGCSKCWESRKQAKFLPRFIPLFPEQQDEWITADQTKPHKPVSTFGKLFGLSVTRAANVSTIVQTASPDRSTVINEECGQSHVLQLSDSAGVVLVLEEDHIRVDLLGESRSFLEHLRRSWNRFKSHSYLPQEGDTTDPNVTTILCSTVELYPAITENEFYWIDNDHFEACPIRVRVRRNAVNIYQQQD